MPVIAAALLVACLAFAAVLWHRRQGRENTAELDEALTQAREGLKELQWRRAVTRSGRGGGGGGGGGGPVAGRCCSWRSACWRPPSWRSSSASAGGARAG